METLVPKELRECMANVSLSGLIAEIINKYSMELLMYVRFGTICPKIQRFFMTTRCLCECAHPNQNISKTDALLRFHMYLVLFLKDKMVVIRSKKSECQYKTSMFSTINNNKLWFRFRSFKRYHNNFLLIPVLKTLKL